MLVWLDMEEELGKYTTGTIFGKKDVSLRNRVRLSTNFKKPFRTEYSNHVKL